MKRLILAASFGLAVLAFPASALADPAICHNGRLSDDAGQNCADGLYAAAHGGSGAATRPSGSGICYDGKLSDDVGQNCPNDGSYGAIAHYAAPTYHRSYTHSYTHSYTPSYYGGGAGGVPACAAESGNNYSTGPDNTNASSGATGRWQIIPSTAAAYGCNLSTPSGQDACAATIYRHQGAGAWVGCGG